MVGLASGITAGHSALGQVVKSELPKKGRLEILPVEITYPPGTNDGVLLVFPNPASDVLEIKLPQGDKRGWMLELFDQQGQRILKKDWDGLPLEVSALENGIYVLIISKNRERLNTKFIVKR